MVIYIKIYEEIPIFLLFSLQNSYFFPIFWDHEFLFSYFLDPSCYLTPWYCNISLNNHAQDKDIARVDF